jgi:hypothetical protein
MWRNGFVSNNPETMKEGNDMLNLARRLMDDFAQRTGLSGTGGHPQERYLWTDAFAMQTFFGLAHAYNENAYRRQALTLLDEVHHHLARFQPGDERKGWISGLPEEEGQAHPTAGGLRIGKQLPERRPDEPFDERLEWDRDGQYFHYNTRWIQALLQTHQETGEHRYALWAAELLAASAKFIYKADGRVRMYWKMSTDLSRPLVQSMGAHDPLEGLVCVLGILEVVPEMATQLQPMVQDLVVCCRHLDWATTDPLGIGGLLLNLDRVLHLDSHPKDLPESVRPEKLLADCLYGLEAYSYTYHPNQHASQRLAFRECGLSLGLRVIQRRQAELASAGLNPEPLDRFRFLADNIEAFWCHPNNQQSVTWTEHRNINAVTLAASLVAGAV